MASYAVTRARSSWDLKPAEPLSIKACLDVLLDLDRVVYLGIMSRVSLVGAAALVMACGREINEEPVPGPHDSASNGSESGGSGGGSPEANTVSSASDGSSADSTLAASSSSSGSGGSSGSSCSGTASSSSGGSSTGNGSSGGIDAGGARLASRSARASRRYRGAR
jgi:hypothetical protein